VALTADAQTGSGYQSYFVTKSTQFGEYNAWEAFDNDNPLDASAAASAGWASEGPSSQTDTYSSSTGAETGSVEHHTGSVQGEWIQIQLPDSIYLHDIKIHSRAETNYVGNMTGFPKNVYLYGKNSNDWILIKEFTTSSKTLGDAYTEYIDYKKKAFTHFVLVVNSIHVSGTTLNQPGWTSIGQIELFGVPEYDPEAHGTDVVVKSVPNVPNTDWLEVYYDGQDYAADTDFDQANEVLDKSGNNLHGSQTGGVGFDTVYKAFTFDGSNDYIVKTGVPTPTGASNFTFTVSMWFKVPSLATTGILWGMAGETDGTDGSPSDSSLPHGFVNTSGAISWAMWGNDAYTSTGIIQVERWHHCVWTYSGGATGRRVFLDGVEQIASGGVAALNMINATSRLTLGIYPHNLASNPLNGSIANFRLFNRALTYDEIYQLYAYQKEDFGHSTNNMTLKAGRLGIGTSEPRGALDVRGDAYYGCPVFFTAYYGNSGNNNNIAAGSSPNYTTLVFNHTMVNKGGAYNLSTGRCTFPISGYYEVLFRGGSASTAGCQAWIFRNGVAPSTWTASGLKSVGAAWDSSSGNFRNLGIIHFFDYFEAGEYLDVRIVNGSFNASNYNSFSVKYLSN
jgi:hypothetical protein